MWWIQTARATQAGFTRRNVAHAAEELQCTFLALTDAVRFQTQSRLWRRLWPSFKLKVLSRRLAC